MRPLVLDRAQVMDAALREPDFDAGPPVTAYLDLDNGNLVYLYTDADAGADADADDLIDQKAWRWGYPSNARVRAAVTNSPERYLRISPLGRDEIENHLQAFLTSPFASRRVHPDEADKAVAAYGGDYERWAVAMAGRPIYMAWRDYLYDQTLVKIERYLAEHEISPSWT